MASLSELSVTNVGSVGHAAFAVWVQGGLSQTFDTVLHEPLPQTLLAVLDGKAEFSAASVSLQDELRGARF